MLLLVVSAAVQGIGDVLATSALATTAGIRGVLLLWAVDAAIALAGITLYAPWLQRVRPRRLTIGLLAGVSMAILAIWAATRGGDAAPGWWIALGVVNTLQSNLVVLAAWTLARDLFSESQAMRLFGPLSGLAYVGTLFGTGWIALVAGHHDTDWLLLASAGMFGGLALALPVFLEPVTSWPAAPPQLSPMKLWQIPVVRWTGLLEMSNGITWTAMCLAVVAVLQVQPGGVDTLQRSYAELKFFGPAVQALLQITLASPLLLRVGYGGVLLATPLALLVGMLGFALAPGLAAAWVATALLQVAFGAEAAATQVILHKAPAPARAAAGALVTGQLPQVGYLVACAGFLVGDVAATAASLPVADSARWLGWVGVASALAGVAVWRRLRRVLDAGRVA